MPGLRLRGQLLAAVAQDAGKLFEDEKEEGGIPATQKEQGKTKNRDTEVVDMGTETALSGMKAIADYCGVVGLPRTYASITQLINQSRFPARKLLGIWESDKEMIDQWRKKYITEEYPERQPKRKKIKK
jgi:hypothetical protein